MDSATSGLPFDDIRRLLADLPGPDEDARRAVQARDAVLTKPAGSLGKLEEIFPGPGGRAPNAYA